MSRKHTIAIVSDIHYACAAEQARGDGFHYAGVDSAALRLFLRFYRQCIWLKDPLRQNHLLDAFLKQSSGADHVVANGDYTCDTAFVGVQDDAACESVRICTDKLREKFGGQLRLNYGDHEVGKRSLFGGQGGLRLASWHRASNELGIERFWKLELGHYILLGVASPLLALPVYMSDVLPQDRNAWEALRREHLSEVSEAFARLSTKQRVILFCHDPSALPSLLEEKSVRERTGQIEQTIIGHLHSELILRQGRLLAGIPPIAFMGHTTKRITNALSQSRHWKPFQVRLCPALGGIELLKDGGFLSAELDEDATHPPRFQLHRIHR